MSSESRSPAYELTETNRQLSHIAGEYGWPLLGKTVALFRDPVAMLGEHYRRYGSVSRISITGQKAVMLVGPELMKELTLDPGRNYSTKMGWSTFMSDFFAGGVLMRDFEEHRQHRRIMQTAFKSEAMAGYASQLNTIVKHHVARWGRQSQIHFYDESKRLLLNIAFEVFCKNGQSAAEEAQVSQAFTDMMEGTMGMVRKDWPGLLYRRGMNGRRFLEQYFMRCVAEKRRGHDNDILSYFCRETREDGTFFTDAEIANHMIFLMLAAHDTTTSTITMAGYHLAHQIEWQCRLADESRALTHEQPDYDDMLTQMPLTEQVFHEVLRLYPSVSILFRRSIRDCEIQGVAIPAHTMLMAPLIYNHRLDSTWHEPDMFDPLRFSAPRFEQRQHPFAWSPFGGGAHKCIGMHFADMLFKSTFAELLKHYEIQFVSPTYYPSRLQYFPFVKPMDNLPLRLVPRNGH